MAHKLNLGNKRKGGVGGSTSITSLNPTSAQREAADENLQAGSNIRHMNTTVKDPNAVENLGRLLALPRDLCCVPDCKRKYIMWTPNGKFCGKHREEAIEAMRLAKKEKYGA